MSENTVEEYGWHDDGGPGSCGHIAPKVMELIKKHNLRRVLDLGAGNGSLCGMIANLGCEVVGVEYDKKGCEVARGSYPRIPFYNFGVQDDPSDLMSAEEPFEAVISTEVIEHLFSPHLLPLYAARTLKEHGLLIISTPYHGYLKNLALSIADKWDIHHSPLWHGGHIKFWSQKSLTQLLAQNGFSVLEFHGVGRLPYLWMSM